MILLLDLVKARNVDLHPRRSSEVSVTIYQSLSQFAFAFACLENGKLRCVSLCLPAASPVGDRDVQQFLHNSWPAMVSMANPFLSRLGLGSLLVGFRATSP